MISENHSKVASGTCISVDANLVKGRFAFCQVRGVADAATNSNQRFLFPFLQPVRDKTNRTPQPAVFKPKSTIFMSHFLALSGSPTKFSKSGFLLRTLGSILEQRAIELRAIHAVDFPPPEDTNHDLTDQFIADTTDEVRRASAILLLTPATKESVPALLSTLLRRLADDLFLGKPVLLFATGGLPAHVAVLERALRHELVRLGTRTVAARVHIGSGSWITLGNDRPRLSRGAEQEVAGAVDLILRGIRLNELREYSLEVAGR
jgi:FMN reductase